MTAGQHFNAAILFRGIAEGYAKGDHNRRSHQPRKEKFHVAMPPLVDGAGKRRERTVILEDIFFPEKTFKKFNQGGMIKDLRVDKGALKGDIDGVTVRSSIGIAPLPFNFPVPDRQPRLGDPVEKVNGYKVFNDDKPVNLKFFNQLIDITLCRYAHLR